MRLHPDLQSTQIGVSYKHCSNNSSRDVESEEVEILLTKYLYVVNYIWQFCNK